jgi:hypothetical protein
MLRALLACVAVAAIGLAVLATAGNPDPDSAAAFAAEGSAAAEPSPSASFTPVVTGAPSSSRAENASTDAHKTSCVGDTWVYVDGKCAVSKPRKPRMVRVPLYRPAIASVPLGRTGAPLTGATNTAAHASGAVADRHGDASKSALAAPSNAATAASTEPTQQPAATRKKKTAHTQSRRRDPYGYGYGYDRWREVRVDEWSARGYAPRQRDYPRGGYGQFRSFW